MTLLFWIFCGVTLFLFGIGLIYLLSVKSLDIASAAALLIVSLTCGTVVILSFTLFANKSYKAAEQPYASYELVQNPVLSYVDEKPYYIFAVKDGSKTVYFSVYKYDCEIHSGNANQVEFYHTQYISDFSTELFGPLDKTQYVFFIAEDD